MSEINEKNIDEIQRVVKEILAQLGVEATISAKIMAEDERETLAVNIQSEEANLLIGQNGTNLQALQHLVRVVSKQKTTEEINFIIDVNNEYEVELNIIKEKEGLFTFSFKFFDKTVTIEKNNLNTLVETIGDTLKNNLIKK